MDCQRKSKRFASLVKGEGYDEARVNEFMQNYATASALKAWLLGLKGEQKANPAEGYTFLLFFNVEKDKISLLGVGATVE